MQSSVQSLRGLVTRRRAILLAATMGAWVGAGCGEQPPLGPGDEPDAAAGGRVDQEAPKRQSPRHSATSDAATTRAGDATVDAIADARNPVPDAGGTPDTNTDMGPGTDGAVPRPDAGGPPTKGLRYHPGFWLAATGPVEVDADLVSSQLDRLRGWIAGDHLLESAVVGFVGRENWASYEPNAPNGWAPGEPVSQALKDHHFDWTRMDRILAWHQAAGLRYWAMLDHKSYNNASKHVAPAWARDDFQYDRVADSHGACPGKGNIVPIWQSKARDAWSVFLRAFVERYGSDDRLGLISFQESDSYCTKLPGFTKRGYADGQMHALTVTRAASSSLNIVQMGNFGLWETVWSHAIGLEPPAGLSASDTIPFGGYPDGPVTSTTHAFARTHADSVPAFWQVQASDLHRRNCKNKEAWSTELPECHTEGDHPCKAMDVACFLVRRLRVDGIAFAAYNDRKADILEAIRAYHDALPASAFQP